MKKNITKTQEEDFNTEFENAFYIMETSKGWYQVRMTSTHFCSACGSDLQKLLDAITKIVTKYSSEEELLNTYDQMDSGTRNMSPATLDQYKEQYSDRGHLYDVDIDIAVRKGLKLRPKRTDKLKKVQKFKATPKTPEPPTQKKGLPMKFKPKSKEQEKTTKVQETSTKVKPLDPPKKKKGLVLPIKRKAH